MSLDFRSIDVLQAVDNIQVTADTKYNIVRKKTKSCQGSLGNELPI